MSRLTDEQVLTIARAGVLASRQGDLLSDFERELIREIGGRFVEHGRNTVITPAEWIPFSQAVSAMWAAERRNAQADMAMAPAARLTPTKAA